MNTTQINITDIINLYCLRIVRRIVIIRKLNSKFFLNEIDGMGIDLLKSPKNPANTVELFDRCFAGIRNIFFVFKGFLDVCI